MQGIGSSLFYPPSSPSSFPMAGSACPSQISAEKTIFYWYLTTFHPPGRHWVISLCLTPLNKRPFPPELDICRQQDQWFPLKWGEKKKSHFFPRDKELLGNVVLIPHPLPLPICMEYPPESGIFFFKVSLFGKRVEIIFIGYFIF